MLRIKQTATQTGFSVDTLRFYDKEKIASPSHRADNGYRLYTAEDIDKLLFIRRAKAIGFTLEDVRELLQLRLLKSSKSCEDVKSVTARKLGDVKEKIAELEKFRRALQTLHDGCCGGAEIAQHCTILQALDDQKEETH